MYNDETIEWKGELWTRKYIEHTFSHHLYRGSAMETSSDCGNCDGANCDICREIWTVCVASAPSDPTRKRPNFDYRVFSDKESAEEYFNEA